MRIRQITTRLMDRRTELLDRYYGELERAAEEHELHPAEDIESATEQWDERMLSRMSQADAIGLGRIVAALQRLAKGTYGRCIECGAAIGASRLQVLPEAETCFECACDADAQIHLAR